jgi:hypothetical protein
MVDVGDFASNDKPVFYMFSGFIYDIITSASFKGWIDSQGAISGFDELFDHFNWSGDPITAYNVLGENHWKHVLFEIVTRLGGDPWLPDLWTQYATQSDVEIRRLVLDLTAKYIIEIADTLFIEVLQTERAMLAIAEQNNILNRRINPDDVKGPVPDELRIIGDPIVANEDMPAGYTQFLGDRIKTDFIDGDELLNTLLDFKRNYFTSARCLELARKSCGMGLLETTSKLYFIIGTSICHSSDGDLDTIDDSTYHHAKDFEWYLGVESKMAFCILKIHFNAVVRGI